MTIGVVCENLNEFKNFIDNCVRESDIIIKENRYTCTTIDGNTYIYVHMGSKGYRVDQIIFFEISQKYPIDFYDKVIFGLLSQVLPKEFKQFRIQFLRER